jgi:heme/copper-type cytochrome/quinol oxidase subunit 1
MLSVMIIAGGLVLLVVGPALLIVARDFSHPRLGVIGLILSVFFLVLIVARGRPEMRRAELAKHATQHRR